MNKFNMIRDINGYNGFGLQFTDVMWQGILLAGVEQTIIVPESPFADFKNLLMIFSFQPGSSIWVARNQNATVPAGSVTECVSEMNPTARQVYAGDEINFITNDSSNEFGATLYAFQTQ